MDFSESGRMVRDHKEDSPTSLGAPDAKGNQECSAGIPVTESMSAIPKVSNQSGTTEFKPSSLL